MKIGKKTFFFASKRNKIIGLNFPMILGKGMVYSMHDFFAKNE